PGRGRAERQVAPPDQRCQEQPGEQDAEGGDLQGVDGRGVESQGRVLAQHLGEQAAGAPAHRGGGDEQAALEGGHGCASRRAGASRSATPRGSAQRSRYSASSASAWIRTTPSTSFHCWAEDSPPRRNHSSLSRITSSGETTWTWHSPTRW